jgi:hypothetical protein
MQQVSRDENTVVNNLAQQALGFRSNQGKFRFLENPDVTVYQTGWSGFQPMHSPIICSTEPSSTKPDGMVSETGGSRISRNSDKSSETTTVDPNDWRTPLVRYLENSGLIADREVRQQAL